MQMAMLSQEDLAAYMSSSYNDNVNATYESNLEKLGAVDMNSPSLTLIFMRKALMIRKLLQILSIRIMKSRKQMARKAMLSAIMIS